MMKWSIECAAVYVCLRAVMLTSDASFLAMYAVPSEVERPNAPGMTINESYDTVLDQSSSIQSNDYLTMATATSAFAGHEKTELSGRNKAAVSSQSVQRMPTFTGQDQSAFYIQEKATFSSRDPAIFSSRDNTEFFGGQEKAAFPTIKNISSDKFVCFCVFFGIVVAILLLAGLACGSVALWLSSRSRADIAELQAGQASTQMGLEESNPAASCFVVLFLNPFSTSGYYWIRSSNGSSVRAYCDFSAPCNGLTGGWMRIANLDFSNVSISCPKGLTERIDSGIRTCGIASVFPTCVSVMLPSNGIFYSSVCGKVNGYQFGSTDAFSDFARGTDLTINSNYVDGVSLTYGGRSRKHIWTFAAALNDIPSIPSASCQCMAPGSQNIPPAPTFVQNDYFCATGSRIHDIFTRFYASDPLWDGLGCAVNSTCCSFRNPPWFYKSLESTTTDNIEMRVCSDEPRQSEDIGISHVELYVHY